MSDVPFIKNFAGIDSPSQPTNIYFDIEQTFSKLANNDVAVRKDSRAIAQSIRNIVLTNPDDVDEIENFGVGVWSLLGENIDAISILGIQDKVKEQCAMWEPRAEITDVKVEAVYGEHTVRIRVYYYPINVNEEVYVDVEVTRVL